MIVDEEVRPMAAYELTIDHQPEIDFILERLEESTALHDQELMTILSLADRVMLVAETTCLALTSELGCLSAAAPLSGTEP